MSSRKVERGGRNAFSKRMPEITSAKSLHCHPSYQPAHLASNLCLSSTATPKIASNTQGANPDQFFPTKPLVI